MFVMMARISRCTPQMAKGIAARLRAKGYVGGSPPPRCC